MMDNDVDGDHDALGVDDAADVADVDDDVDDDDDDDGVDDVNDGDDDLVVDHDVDDDDGDDYDDVDGDDDVDDDDVDGDGDDDDDDDDCDCDCDDFPFLFFCLHHSIVKSFLQAHLMVSSSGCLSAGSSWEGCGLESPFGNALGPTGTWEETFCLLHVLTDAVLGSLKGLIWRWTTLMLCSFALFGDAEVAPTLRHIHLSDTSLLVS